MVNAWRKITARRSIVPDGCCNCCAFAVLMYSAIKSTILTIFKGRRRLKHNNPNMMSSEPSLISLEMKLLITNVREDKTLHICRCFYFLPAGLENRIETNVHREHDAKRGVEIWGLMTAAGPIFGAADESA